MKYAIAKCKTKLKANSRQSSELPSEQIIEIQAGEVIPIKGCQTKDGHLILECDFYAFSEHWEIQSVDELPKSGGTLILNRPVADLGIDPITIKSVRESVDGLSLIVTLPNDGIITILKDYIELIDLDDYQPPSEPIETIPSITPGKIVNIPGVGNININQSIIPNGHFSWSEATKGGSRIPLDTAISGRVISMAHRLEEVRQRLGNRPIMITSWYRPPAVNRAVGGASQSRHLTGDGVDFQVSGLSPRNVQKLLEWWDGGMGYGSNFTHLDNRGYRSRWNYG
jgi:hypothetical protein